MAVIRRNFTSADRCRLSARFCSLWRFRHSTKKCGHLHLHLRDGWRQLALGCSTYCGAALAYVCVAEDKFPYRCRCDCKGRSADL